MAITYGSRERSGTVESTNLIAVVAATDGETVHTADFKDKTVFVNVSVNTGAVTVTIQASPDGVVWYDVRSDIHTATTALDVISFTDHFPYMRTRTTSQTNSTVTTTIKAR